MKLSTTLARHSLSRAAVMGGAFGFMMIAGAILLSSNHLLAFFSLEGLMIVVGGVIAVAFMSYQESDVRNALRAIRLMFKEPHATHDTLHHDMLRILGWARIVKDRGLMGLESNMEKYGVNEPFVKYGLNMVVSNYDPEEIRAMMETAADAYYERDTMPAQVLQSMASHAPAFGMIGTLVGMVTMLCNLTDNVAGIGSCLAVSFLSTLYGVVSARMVYMPAASKIMQKQDALRFRNYLITEGMAMLVSNKSMIYIQDRLNSFLRPEIHDSLNIDMVNKLIAPRLKTVRT